MKNLKSLVYVIALLGGLLHVINSATGIISPMQMRPIHVALIFSLAFLLDISKNKTSGWRFFSTWL